jgi:signal transduction histidine kinase
VNLLTSLREAHPCLQGPERLASDAQASLRARVRELEAEREDLWRWIYHLERLAQTGLMAGGMVHDVTNLLTAIMGRSDLALNHADPLAQRAALTQNLDLARHAAETLRVFLAFARRQDVRRERVRVSVVVSDALRFLQHATRTGRVTVESRFAPDDEALCNRTLLLQAVVNLLLNSTSAMAPRGGHIYVRTERHGNRVRLDLEDDGPGVPESLRAHLFEPFVSGEPREVGGIRTGTGLGLFITRQIVEEMGGRIRFRTRDGAGTTFSVLLRSEASPTGRGTTPEEARDGI